ncbi:MAG: PKD domain-containing protein [Gammaproteobacteria bacterium]|nr:PKD domain-containing protein [Gammaproteobacteria bacterium]
MNLQSNLNRTALLNFVFILLLSLFQATSANVLLEWEKTFGWSGNDYIRTMVQTSDGGYALAGNSDSKSASWIMKLDANLNQEWQQISGTGDFYSIIQTSDGGFAALTSGVRVVKLDAGGNIEWDKGFRYNSQATSAYSIVQTADGGFVVAGTTSRTVSSSTTRYYDQNIWVIKLDNSGNAVWEKIHSKGTYDRDYANAVIQTADGGFAIAGSSTYYRKYNSTTTSYPYNDWILKLDSDGVLKWNKSYGGSEYDQAYDIVQTSDGGFAVAGYTNSDGAGNSDFWVYKLSNNGNLVWDKTFGGTGSEQARSIIQTSDGGFAAAGYTNSKGEGGTDYWVVKLDGGGSLIWDKTLGGASADDAYTIVQTADDSFAVAGYTQSKGAGGYDGWFIKFMPTPPLVLSSIGPSAANGKTPLEVTFTSTFSGGKPPYIYAWEFGDGGTADIAEPSYTYNTAGTFSASLTITGTGGQTITGNSDNITVEKSNEDPTAIFNVNPLSGDAPLTVNLDGSASEDIDGNIVSYVWTSSDGQTASGETASLTFNNSGSYTISLTVTDNHADSGSAEYPDPVIVNEKPRAVASGNPLSGYVPLTVNLDGSASNDSDGSIVSYAWSSSNGQTASGKTASLTFNNSGNYTVTLTVTDDQGGSGSTEYPDFVAAYEKPRAAANVDPLSGYAPLTVNLDASDSKPDGSIVSYAWSSSDGQTSTAANDSFSFSNPGTYTIDLTVTDDKGAVDVVSKTVLVQEPIRYSITASAGLGGSVGVNPNQADYAPGDIVTVTAGANECYGFSHWTGTGAGMCGANNPVCTLTIDADRTLTANFLQPAYSLSLTAPHGTASRLPAKAEYTCGESVTLQFEPDDGYRFTGWTGDAGCENQPVSMKADISCDAQVELNQPPVIVTEGAGSVQIFPLQAEVSLNLTLEAGDAYDADGSIASYEWSVNGQTLTGKTAAITLTVAGVYPVVLTVTDNEGATASYSATVKAVPLYTLSVNKAGSGSGTVSAVGIYCGNDCEENYAEGQSVSLAVTADSDSLFTEWQGECSGGQVSMTQDISCTALFTRNQAPIIHNLSVTPRQGEIPLAVNLDAGDSYDPDGSIVSYEWLVDSQTLTGKTASVTLNAINTYPVTLSITDDMGAVTSETIPVETLPLLSIIREGNGFGVVKAAGIECGADCEEAYEQGVKVTLEAIANAGSRFVAWSGIEDCSDGDVTMNASIDCTADFVLNRLPVMSNVQVSPESAQAPVSVTLNAGDSFDPDGSIVSFTWTINGQNVTGKAVSTELTAAGDYPVLLTLVDNDGGTLTEEVASVHVEPPAQGVLTAGVVPVDAGQITVTPDKPNYAITETASLTALANDCYVFDHWADACSGNTPVCSVLMNEGKSVIAHFRKKTYPLYSVSTHGTVSRSPVSTEYECNDFVELTALPEEGYRFGRWDGIDVNDYLSDNAIAVQMNAARTITALFEPATYTVNLATAPVPLPAGAQVTVNPDKEEYGNETLTFTAEVVQADTADSNYRFDHWEGDLSGSAPQVTAVIAQDMNVTAVFVPIDTLAINPAFNEVVSGASLVLNAVGGAGDYIWQAPQGGKLTPTRGASVNYTPPIAAGEYSLELTDMQNATAYAAVKVYEILSLSPASAEVVVSSQQEFSVNGGKAPYAVSSTLGQATAVTQGKLNFAAEQAGSATVTVTDALGQEQSVQIQVVTITSPSIIPNEVTLIQHETTELSVAGGKPLYTWTIQAGNLSSDTGGRVAYTAPETTGKYWVRIMDAHDQQAEATVSVIPPDSPPVITPASATLFAGESKIFQIAGGKTPYNPVIALLGQISEQNEGGFVYTAPKLVASDTVTVTDNLEKTGSTQITVISPIFVTPAEVTLDQREITELSVTGGKPPYTWTAQAGNLSSDTGDRTAYTAPETTGKYWVRVTDALNKAAEAAVSVSLTGSPPVITPAAATLFTGETKKFQIAGGKKPYVSLSALHGQISKQSEELFIYTAPGLAADDTVTVTDSLGQKGSTQIQAIARSLPDITPAEVTLVPHGITELSVTGGKSPYTWIAQAGNLSASTGEKTAYTAPETTGEYWVRVTDAFNQAAEAAISVIDGSCVITPAAATLAMGETKKFQIAGGKKPYASITALHGQISEQGEDSFIYTAPEAAGDTVTVTDSLGQKCSTQITGRVIGDLLLSPVSAHLVLDTTQTVLFKAVNGVGSFTWTALQGGQLQENGEQEAIYTPPAQIGKYPVEVRDGLNRGAQAFVSVVNLPKISPARVMLQLEDVYPFQVAGGQPPHVWATKKGGFSAYEGVSNKHIASADIGVYQITVTDAFGHISTAQVTVNNGLEIRPARALADVNETRYFVVSGGVPPYAWSDDSQGASAEIAHSVTGQHEIFVSDSAGHRAVALLEVKAVNTELLPEVMYAKPGETIDIKIEMPEQCVWTAGAGSLASHESQQVGYIVPEEPGKYYVQAGDCSQEGYIEVLVGLGLTDLNDNTPENAKPVLSQISVDGVRRHERVLEGNQETLWDIEFFMSLPDDGQLYNTHLAIFWTDVTGEIPPRVFLQTNNPDEPFVDFYALPPGAPLPANREGVNGEQMIDVYHGALAGVVGMLDFFLGYAPADKPDALVYTPVPYRLDVK